MTDADAERPRPRRFRWRTTARLPCCSCLRGEERDPLQERGRKSPHVCQQGAGEREAIHVTLEDLGIVNASFSLLEEGPLTQRDNVIRSASSASTRPRAQRKKRLQHLSSLPVGPHDQQAGILTSQEDNEDHAFENVASGSLLPPPVINLVPPTPSDVVDDDQFFDTDSVEGAAQADGSDTAGDGEQRGQGTETVEADQTKEGFIHPDNVLGVDSEARLECRDEEKDKAKLRLSRGSYQGASLPEYPQKNDRSNKDGSSTEILKAEVSQNLQSATMDAFTHQRRQIIHSGGRGHTLTRSATFHALTQTSDQQQEDKESPQQRRTTVASYVPPSTDQNGNFTEKDVDRQEAKSLRELSTDEVCSWFTSVGLQKCLPFIREAKLCGADIASIDAKTLDVLRISALDDRERLLSAIYNELHPPSAVTQRLDELLEAVGPNQAETVTATLMSMSKSKSSPHVSCLSMNRRSLKLRNMNHNQLVQRNSQLIEITINASERIVHLRTPKETTVGKVAESCIKMLGMTEDKSLFSLKEQQGSSVELSADQQIGSLLTSETRQLELHLDKTDKPSSSASQSGSDVSSENGGKNAKEERIKELNKQVDSLQNVILQVQELHHGLVAFCSELKTTDEDVTAERLGSAELKQRLDAVQSRLNDKRQSLQTLREHVNNSAAHKNKQLDIRLLEKMKLNCQVFKEEISLVHLNRQAAHLRGALQESYAKEKSERKAIGCLSQLVSPRSPAMLLLVQEVQRPDGLYGFTCRYAESGGLVVVKVNDSQLCVDDRLVEVNGVPVVNSTEEELEKLLLQTDSAQIVVLRQPPPPPPTSHPPPLLQQQQHMAGPHPLDTICSERDVIAMETPYLRKVVAI